MPSVQDVLSQRARDERLSIYTSPTFCRRSRLDNELVREKPDKFGWLRAFDPKRSCPSIMAKVPSSRPSSASFDNSRTRKESDTDSMSLEGNEHPNSSPTTPSIDSKTPTKHTLLARRRNQRPISLEMDNHRSMGNLDMDPTPNDNTHEELKASTGSPRAKKFLSVERSAVESLSKSCGDLRQEELGTPPFVKQFHRQYDPFRCPSHHSLCSIQVSSPTQTDSRAGSRISLLSEGVDSYEGLYERAYKATFVLGSQNPPTAKEERQKMVQEWLEKQENVDSVATNVNDPPSV